MSCPFPDKISLMSDENPLTLEKIPLKSDEIFLTSDDISLVLDKIRPLMDDICLAVDKICPFPDNIYTPMGNNHSSSPRHVCGLTYHITSKLSFQKLTITMISKGAERGQPKNRFWKSGNLFRTSG
jgi:hypothetical protein